MHVANTMVPLPHDEATLLRQAKAGNCQAFEHAILPHLGGLLAYSRAICGDFHAAQDVVQETALVAFRNLDRFFAEADFATWLKAIARRQALAARRKLGKQQPAGEGLLEAVYETDSEEEPERKTALRACLDSLPPDERQLIHHRYAEGERVEEIAARSSTNVDTLRWRMYRLRQALRECVERRLRREGWA